MSNLSTNKYYISENKNNNINHTEDENWTEVKKKRNIKEKEEKQQYNKYGNYNGYNDYDYDNDYDENINNDNQNNNSDEKNRKKILCNNILMYGSCGYGDKCMYAHSLSEQNIDSIRKKAYDIIKKIIPYDPKMLKDNYLMETLIILTKT
jgi:hypothetical protein